jgi:hypothetical protein
MLLRMPVTQTPAAKTVQSGQGPGGTRGKMTELSPLLSARRSFFLALTSELCHGSLALLSARRAHKTLSSVCCVLVHPCLRESPRHLLNGQALTREGWAGTEKTKYRAGRPASPGPGGQGQPHGSSRANHPRPRNIRLAVRCTATFRRL